MDTHKLVWAATAVFIFVFFVAAFILAPLGVPAWLGVPICILLGMPVAGLILFWDDVFYPGRSVKKSLRILWRKIRQALFPSLGYVIIFDHGDEDEPTEEYYGYFSSVAEAEQVWNDFKKGYDRKFRSVYICRMVKGLPAE